MYVAKLQGTNIIIILTTYLRGGSFGTRVGIGMATVRCDGTCWLLAILLGGVGRLNIGRTGGNCRRGWFSGVQDPGAKFLPACGGNDQWN